MTTTAHHPPRLRARSGLLALAGAASVAALVAGCGGSAAGESAAADSPTCPNGKIRFGVEPYEDPAKLEPAYREVADALSDALDCPVEVSIVEDYSAEVLAMQNGKLELAQFGPLGFVFASRRAGAQPVASFADASGTLSTYTAGIWVPKGSPVTDVEGLEGKSLALSSPASTSGDALPRQAIKAAGMGEGDVEITYAGGHPEALLALTNGAVDAAEINSQTLTSAQAAGQFDPAGYTQVWESGPVPNDPVTVRADLPVEFRDAAQEALTALPPETVGKVGQYLDVTPPGPMVAVTEEDYQALFDLADELGLTEKDA